MGEAGEGEWSSPALLYAVESRAPSTVRWWRGLDEWMNGPHCTLGVCLHGTTDLSAKPRVAKPRLVPLKDRRRGGEKGRSCGQECPLSVPEDRARADLPPLRHGRGARVEFIPCSN